jgi:hypothetical protein
VFSSRALESATYDSVAFLFISDNEHPDHDTMVTFRKRFIGQIGPLFIDVLQRAGAMGMLKVGTVGRMALRSTPTRAGTVPCRTAMPARSRSSYRRKCSSCCGSRSGPMRQISLYAS